MGLRSGLRHLIGGKAAGDQPGWSVLEGIVTKAEWNDADNVWKSYSKKQREEAYGICSLIFACVREICTSLVEARPEIGIEQDGVWEPVEGHQTLDLLRDPNPDYDYSDLMQYIGARLMLTGESFTWKWRDKGGMLRELWPLPTNMVEVAYAMLTQEQSPASRLVAGYGVKQGGGKKNLPVAVEDMAYTRFIDPAKTTGGIGPMQAAIRDYQLDIERSDYLVEMLTNLKVPGIKIKSASVLTPEMRQDMRGYLHDTIGKGKRGNPIFIEGPDVDMELLAPLKDLDWPGLTSLTETRICMAFGVPPILIGSRAGLDRSTYSNYGEARQSFYQETMIPFWRSLGAMLTRCLLRHEGEDRLEVRFDTGEIDALQENATERAQRAEIGMRSGLMLRNEGRALLGLDEVDDGNVYLLPLSTVEVPARTAAEMAAEAAQPEPAPAPPPVGDDEPEGEANGEANSEEA